VLVARATEGSSPRTQSDRSSSRQKSAACTIATTASPRSHGWRPYDQEFYQLLDAAGIRDDIHLFNQKLREWEDYSHYHRPHGALNGQTP
jgi:hypothetical protein